MQKLVATNKLIDNETRTVFVSYMSDWFSKKKHFEEMNHVFYLSYKNQLTVMFYETIFNKLYQEHFLFLFQIANISAKQEVMSVSQRLVLLKGSSACSPHRRVKWSFLLILPSPTHQALLGRRGYQLLV